MPLIATNSTRVNSQGRPALNDIAKTSVRLAGAIPANGFVTLSCSGVFFYILNASASLFIRPTGGVFNEYFVGTGLEISAQVNAFNTLELRNDNAFPIVYEIFAGWDAFIDKRLILTQQQTPQVLNPTYPTANAATSVAITDLSGAAFTDINGNQWYAIYRVAMIVCNPDSGVTLLLQEAGSVISNGPAVAVIYPQTSLRLDAAGDYALNLGGALINAIVSEIYAAIAA